MSMNESFLLIGIVLFVAFVLLRLYISRRSATDQTEREANERAERKAIRHQAGKRLEIEEAARLEAIRKVAEETVRREAQRQAVEEAERIEAKRQAAEEAIRLEVESQAAEEAARRGAERQAAEEAVRLEAKRQTAEEAACREAERQAAEEAVRLEAKRQAAEEALRYEAVEAQRHALAVAIPAVELKAKTPEQTLVMVADDSKVVRVKTGRLLTANKYQILMAEDGLDAARQIDTTIPDLLITDVDMPGMGGMQLVQQLRSNQRTVHLPIIMITSNNDELRTEALASGVDVVLGKPYPEDQLIAHIQRLMIGQKSG